MSQQSPTILDGRYELFDLLGEGGMGQVYKARHTRLGKIFAIKSLRNLSPDPNEQAKFLEAFETEARCENTSKSRCSMMSRIPP